MNLIIKNSVKFEDISVDNLTKFTLVTGYQLDSLRSLLREAYADTPNKLQPGLVELPEVHYSLVPRLLRELRKIYESNPHPTFFTSQSMDVIREFTEQELGIVLRLSTSKRDPSKINVHSISVERMKQALEFSVEVR
jgi:hypothetical protein